MITKHEFYIFKNYSAGIKEWLKNTCYLSNYPKEENVNVVFSTPERAWAKFLNPISNGSPVSPYISFDLTSHSEKDGELPLGFVTQRSRDVNKFEMIRHPLVYELGYTVSIFTRLRSEADVLAYQIISNSSKNRKGVIKVDNQWAELWGHDLTNESELDGGETADRFIKFSLEITVPRAYVPLIYDYERIILSTDLEQEEVYDI
jgi:hypothetical protein